MGDVRHAGQERPRRESVRPVQEHARMPAVRQGMEKATQLNFLLAVIVVVVAVAAVFMWYSS